MPLAVYVDEVGAVIATEEYQANTETYTPALKLAVTERHFDCLGCGAQFVAQPGNASCPRCPSLYYGELVANGL